MMPHEENNIRRISSVHRMDSNFSNASEEDILNNTTSSAAQVNEQIITVTFEEEGSLGLVLQGTVEDEMIVSGFENGSSLAKECGAIMIGDLLISINDTYFNTIHFNEAITMITASTRPLTLRFLRVEQTRMETQHIVAEGWVLAKEAGNIVH